MVVGVGGTVGQPLSIANQTISVIQINLNKAHAAHRELLHKINSVDSYIALITEPFCYKKKLCIIPKGSNCLPQIRSGHPRACIFSSKNIKIHEINELKSRDVAVGLTKLEGKSTVIVSLYLDINIQIEPIMTPILEYCQTHGYGILIGADTNAHHTDWGLETNERGRQLEAIIDSFGLVIHNKGKIPTYESKLGKSVIDVTMSSRLPLKIDNWRVNRTFNGSDHNTILYQLKTDIIELPPYRDYSRADWSLFKNELEKTQIHIPANLNQKKLDKMVYKITNCIEQATEKCCPLKPAKLVNKNNPWWTPQMADMRKEVTALYRNFLRNKQNERTYHNYKQVFRKYKNLCNKAKDKHRKRTNEIIPDESKMSKHIKSLSDRICPEIGSVLKPDGSTSLIGKDTHDTVMDTHFPRNTDIRPTAYQKQLTIATEELEIYFGKWLSIDRIKLALGSFKDKKTPGPDGMKPIVFKYFPIKTIEQLQIIYKAVIKLHFTPTLWKDAKVIFIPKPGKLITAHQKRSDQYH